MFGLLNLGGWDDPRRQALMAAAFQAMQGGHGGTMGALGRAGVAGLGAFNQAGLLADRRAQEKQEREFRQRQMGLMDQQEAERGRIADIYSRNTMPGNLTPNDDMGNPMPAAPQGVNLQALQQGLMAAGPAGMREAAAVQGMMPKPAAPLVLGKGARAFGPDGREIAANPEPEKPQIREVKTGNRIITYEMRGGEWKKIAEAPLYKPDGPEKPPAPPPGYRWVVPGQEVAPLKGGPADTKAGKEAEAAQRREQGALERADMVLGRVNDAIQKTGFLTTGIRGAIGRNIPGTDAYDLNRTIDTIKANIGFGELQAMREASPTGGALGQVAVQELNMLQSVLGSLDTAQGQDQLLKSLNAINKHYMNWKLAVQQARMEREKPASGGFKYLGPE